MLRRGLSDQSHADALLTRLTSAPDEAGIFLDFDGVLAPIVARPEDAYPPPETRAELERLVARYALVGVVSGRAGDDVRARVGVEGSCTSARTASSSIREARAVAAADPRLRVERAPWAEQHTELKGLTVAFHFRHLADEAAAVRELEEVAARATDEGLVARFGRKVLEVLPPIGSNKGTAVRHLLDGAGLTRALVAGDDTTDIDSFRAVDDLENAVRVAVMSRRSRPRCCASMRTSSSRARTSSSSCCAGSDARRRRDARARARAARRAGRACVGRRDQRPRVEHRDAQPGAHARRDAVHPRSDAHGSR